MRALLPISLSTLLLCACASGPGYGPGPGGASSRPIPVTPNPAPAPADPLARQMSYVCEDLSSVTLQQGTGSARVMTNSGLELGLARQRDGSYGGGTHEFRPQGAQATWHVSGKVFRCRAN